MIKIIYKTITIPVKCSKADYSYLLNCNKESAKVWNYILDIEKKYREEHGGKWVNRNELQKLTKGCVYLHAKGIHHVCYKYLNSRDAALKAKQGNGTNNKYPYRKKRFFVTTWDCQSIKIRSNSILLVKPKKMDVDGKMKCQKDIRCFIKNIPQNIAQVELIYRNGLKLAIKYKEHSEYLQIKSENHASIDLGEIHTITSIDSCGNAVIITGRYMRSLKQHRNKEQAKIYKRMSKCKLHSKQYRKYKKALQNLKHRYDKKILECVHKLTKLYLDFCIENNISLVYYGDLDSATRNTKKNKIANRIVRQKLSQWNYGEVTHHLMNKLSKYGIKMIKVKEYYTSQKCPQCSKLNKPKGRCYKCRKCEYEQHRDIVGAINILNDNDGTKITKYNNKKYLRIDVKSKVVNADVHSQSIII